jgi:proline iminopeptidase
MPSDARPSDARPSDARHAHYPAIEPYAQARMKVSGGHEIYYEECGNPQGKPVVIVHGGPGGGTNATMRRYHDAARYRIIMFDQRGCGRSTPHASLDAPQSRTLAIVRRLMGIDAFACLRDYLSRARHRYDPARHLLVAPL